MIYKYKIIYSNLNKSKMLKGGTQSTSSSTTSSSTSVQEQNIFLNQIINYPLNFRAVIGATE
jgi:hypothetical protein